MTTETTIHATGQWAMLFESDGDGRPDSYWCIEQDPEGFLCVTSNAETRVRIDADRHRGYRGEDRSRTASELRSAFAGDGVPGEIIDRYMEQAGFPDENGVYA